MTSLSVSNQMIHCTDGRIQTDNLDSERLEQSSVNNKFPSWIHIADTSRTAVVHSHLFLLAFREQIVSQVVEVLLDR